MNTAPLSTQPNAPQILTCAFALAATATVFFALTFQDVFFGDGPLLMNAYRRGAPTGHQLHFLVTELFIRLGLTPLGAIRAASCVPAGLATGVLFVGLVRANAPLFIALLGTFFFVSAPSVLFFSTTVEVHGLQLLGVTLAFLSAVKMAFPRPSSGFAGLVFWALLGGLSLAATHPMNLPAGAGFGLLFLVGQRARNASLRTAALAAIGAGSLLIVLALIASFGYLDRQGFSVETLVETFRWRLDQKNAANNLPMPLFNLQEAVLRPALWLVVTGILGLSSNLYMRPKERSLTLGFLAWILVPATLLAGPDFHERGAYFLVALPALAFGATRLAASHRGWAWVILIAGVAQAHTATRQIQAWQQPAPPEAEAWLAGLASLSGGRGVLLAESAQQQDWARRYLGMQADNVRLFLPIPTDDLKTLAQTYADWARDQIDAGEPLFVPKSLIDRAPEIAPLGLAIQILSQQMHFKPVSIAGFSGYIGR